MAFFAEIGADDTVLRILVVPDEEAHRGQEFLANDLKLGGTWIETSMDGSIGKNPAAKGYKWDKSRSGFVSEKPHPSWKLNEATCRWMPPIPMPQAPGDWIWDEDHMGWARFSSVNKEGAKNG